MGWYMVQSGLVDDPRVSQFRLTAHLGLAFVIFGAMFWAAPVAARPAARGVRHRRAAQRARFALASWPSCCSMVLTGGFVAGIRAGFAYNTFPLMNGAVGPARALHARPVVEELLLEHGDRAVRSPPDRVRAARRSLRCCGGGSAGSTTRRRARGAAATCCWRCWRVQIGLGIATLLLVVPLHLAATHQAGAVLVFAAALNLAHALR